MKECAYLGHIVGSGSVKPDPGKLEAVRQFPFPQTKKQVRAFLGLAGYYRRHFSSVASPLTDLTKSTAHASNIKWNKDCAKAFEQLKDALCSNPVLKSPCFDRPFIPQTDASDRGVGAVLSQCDDLGEEHPIAYFSRKLLHREQRYSTVEKECLAIKLSCQSLSAWKALQDTN